MVEHADDVLRHRGHRVVLLRAPVGIAEAAHVHADHLALGAEGLRDLEPVPGEVLQAVDDEQRGAAGLAEAAEVDRDFAGARAPGLMGDRHGISVLLFGGGFAGS
jgi:hypothetical protein